MKILQVLSTLTTGGAETFTVGLINELHRQGCECELLTLWDIEEDNSLYKKINPRVKVSSLHKRSGLDIGIFNKLYKYIRNGKFDVVHAHVAAIPYILRAAICLNNVKFVATIHSEARREAGPNLAKWIRFYLFQHKKCIPVTISEESKASFDSFYNLDSHMVYNGVPANYDIKSLSLRDNPDQILFVHPASCRPIKNQELLFESFKILKSISPNIKLIWVGGKLSYEKLFDSLAPTQIEGIQYEGVVSNVSSYLAEADAMCLSSKMEGMPMTIIEAFSVGCPALCTPVGGILNMIKDGENGMLSKDLTVESYYSMLKSFCNLTLVKREEMRQMARASFNKFSIEKCARGYLDIYKA